MYDSLRATNDQIMTRLRNVGKYIKRVVLLSSQIFFSILSTITRKFSNFSKFEKPPLTSKVQTSQVDLPKLPSARANNTRATKNQRWIQGRTLPITLVTSPT